MTKSKSRSSASGNLSVIAADAGAEIFVMNDRFERVASGVHSLQASLIPGIYKIRFRAGAVMKDVLTEVREGKTPTTVRMDHLHFSTAAPIDQTATTHEYQRDPAQRLSMSLTAASPGGCQLMLFVRDPQEASGNNSMAAVSVCGLDGSPISDSTQGEVNNQQRYAGWNIPIAPGTYRVRVDTGAKGLYEMFVVACTGWQTQVFLVAEDFPYQGELIRRPALRSASVMMSGAGRGFDAFDPTQRLAEQARSALQYGRKAVWTGVVNQLVDGKFENPMLGIYGLHLALLHAKPDAKLMAEVLMNMDRMVPSHPDVAAVRLSSSLPKKLQTPPKAFQNPPMLRSSWDLIVEATASRPGLVPPGSLIDRVADWTVPGGPWLLARVGESPLVEDFVHGRDARSLFRELFHQVNAPAVRVSIRKRRALPRELTALQRNVLDFAMADSWFGDDGDDERVGRGYTRAPSLQQVIASLKVPACSIARTSAFLLKWSAGK